LVDRVFYPRKGEQFVIEIEVTRNDCNDTDMAAVAS